MSLRTVDRVIVIAEFAEEKHLRQFRKEALWQFYSTVCPGCSRYHAKSTTECGTCGSVLTGKSRGITYAKDAVDALRDGHAPKTTSDFTEYAKQIEAGCNALPKLMDELRSEYLHDEEGNKIEGEDGDWMKKEPTVVFPITAKGDIAWGAYNRAEGFAVPEALPNQYAQTHRIRQRLANGSLKSLDKQIALLKLGQTDAPALLALLEEAQGMPDMVRELLS